MSRRPRSSLVAAAALVWVVIVAAGFETLRRYTATPGPSGRVAAHWPDGALARQSRRPTLVMVLHPECPCSRASVGELARVLARRRERVDAHVLVAVPPGLPDAASRGLVRQARAIPGVHVTLDPDGRRTAAFGTLVSGHTLLYDARGSLVFEGGITASRGHAGDNANEDALVDAIDSGRAGQRRTPVFGCLLKSAAS